MRPITYNALVLGNFREYGHKLYGAKTTFSGYMSAAEGIGSVSSTTIT